MLKYSGCPLKENGKEVKGIKRIIKAQEQSNVEQEEKNERTEDVKENEKQKYGKVI